MVRPVAATGAVVLAVTVVLSVAVAPVAAHANDVEADDQRSADGTLHVEWEFVVSDGWIVVRADDDGEPGEVLGHRRVDPETAFRTDTTVAIREEAWAEVTERRDVWVVLHSEEDGSGFDVEDDPARTGFSGDPAGARLTVERADAATSVAAQGFGPQTSTDGTVTVRRVELAENGYLAVHAVNGDIAATVEDRDVGEPVGAVRLPAGVHENVTVELDGSYLAGAGNDELLEAVVHAGSGEFEADSTVPVTAGDSLVSTTFGVEFRGAAASGPTPSPTPEKSSIVTTPSPSPGESSTVTTPSPTETLAGTTTGGDGAGVGGLGTALAVALAALVARRRR